MTTGGRVHLERREDTHEYLLETLEVPVLVDDGVDDARKENLLRFVGKQIHQVMHLVDALKILNVLLAPLWQQLLTEQVNKVLNILVIGKINVLARVCKAHLDLVHERSAHGDSHGLHCGLFRIGHFEILNY